MYCDYISQRDLGRCNRNTSTNEILKSIKYIKENSFLKENIKPLSNAIRAKRYDPEDFEYWIDYAFDIGTHHLK